MKPEAFEQLVLSVRQAGRIRRGAARASRTFALVPADVKVVHRKRAGRKRVRARSPRATRP